MGVDGVVAREPGPRAQEANPDGRRLGPQLVARPGFVDQLGPRVDLLDDSFECRLLDMDYPIGLYCMQTVAETPMFTRQADKLFDEEEKRQLVNALAENPRAGVLIPGGGGVRKLRFAASGRGKRGGARVIYYFVDEDMPVYALLVYPKGTKTDLTPEEKRTVRALAAELRGARRQQQ